MTEASPIIGRSNSYRLKAATVAERMTCSEWIQARLDGATPNVFRGSNNILHTCWQENIWVDVSAQGFAGRTPRQNVRR
jgi:hypothetical protein